MLGLAKPGRNKKTVRPTTEKSGDDVYGTTLYFIYLFIL